MSQFTFNRGRWEDGSPLSKWEDDEEHQAYVSRIGYKPLSSSFGSEDGGEVEIYESANDNSFYANICPLGGSCFDIFLPDFPSLMIFLKDYAAIFSLASINSVQQETLSILEKIFQITHGHSAYSICNQCDPDRWEKYKRLEGERSARNAAKKKDDD